MSNYFLDKIKQINDDYIVVCNDLVIITDVYGKDFYLDHHMQDKIQTVYDFFQEFNEYIQQLKRGDKIVVSDSIKNKQEATVIRINKSKDRKISSISFQIEYKHCKYVGKVNIKEPSIFNDIVYKNVRYHEVVRIIEGFFKYPLSLPATIKYILEDLEQVYNTLKGGN